jgi:predicted RND superfamily exporter protein
LLLYELSLPLGLDLNDQLNVDKSSTRVIITMTDVTAEEVRSLKRRGDAWLAQALPQTMRDAQGVGPAVMFSFIAERNINSMIIGTSAALVLISLSLIIPFWSIRFGLVSLIPNLAPAIMTFGLWALIEGRIGMASAVVVASSLGIVVDATIHLMSKYLRGRRVRGLSPEDSVRFAFSTVGPALWLLTVLLIAGFGILALSPFEVNRALGLLTAIAIFFAVFCDFLMLPPLLMAVEKRAAKAAAVPDAVPAK